MKVAIIGAGPAGIFSTLLLKGFDGEVTLFEQNKRLGEKLRTTGGGRMNVTNKIFSVDEFTSENTRALKHLFKSPWVKNRYDILNELGIEYVWEKHRAILKSGDAFAEVERLAQAIHTQQNAEISLNSKVTNIMPKNNQWNIQYEQNGKLLNKFFDHMILSGGGMYRMFSREQFDGIYALPLQLKHTITSVRPSLSPLRIRNNPFKPLSGTAMVLSLSVPGEKITMTNDTLFTHFGLSGPLVLDFSTHLPPDGNCEACFLPELKEEDFVSQFNHLRNGKNLLRKFLHQWMPKKVVDWHITQLGLEISVNIADISKDILKQLRKSLFRFPLREARTFQYSACWTTRGGVDLGEINVATLESKIHPHLFFAGEVLDVNGLCGGYNISFAAISAKIISEALLKSA